MKKNIFKRIVMVCIAVLMAFMLSSCSILGSLLNMLMFGDEISLEYALTQEDLTEFSEIVSECETLAMDENADMIALSMLIVEMTDKLEYIDVQSTIGYLEYCQDQTNERAIAHYKESEEMYADARLQYLALLKKLILESPIKDELFAGYTEEELALFLIDHEKISDLQLENSEIERSFYALEEDENWSNNVNALYVDVVENNQQMAIEYGYDNYYDLASEMIYNRHYTLEQRQTFRGYVAEYIVPLYSQVVAVEQAAQAALSEAEMAEYTAIYSSNEFLYGYMDTYKGSVHSKMSAMLEKSNASIFASNENALKGAFTTYIGYFNQPLAYFGPGYQDLFTIVHEMGHYVAYHHYQNSTLPFDLAETHSQGNEWMMMAYLKDKVSPKVFHALYSNKLRSSMTTVIYSTLVDHFEEIVYTAETPLTAMEYATVMDTVCAQYPGINEALNGAKYTPFSYAQRVALTSPGYYLSYATSEIASMGFYVMAQEESYLDAQCAYIYLQESVDITKNFSGAIKDAGLPSPFEQKTYEDLKKVFLSE